jgi:PAS domain S-box-containing protein
MTNIDWILTGKANQPYTINSERYCKLNPYGFEVLRHVQDYDSDLLVSFIDTDERFQLVNKKYETIFPMAVEDVYGKKLSDMIGEQGYTVCKPYIDSALKGETVKFTYPWLQSNGKYKNLRIQYVPYKDENDTVIGFFSYIEDLDSIKKSKFFTDNRLSSILPILRPKSKPDFDANNFKNCIDIALRQVKSKGITLGDDDFIELAKHIYDYSILNSGENLDSYTDRILEIALRAKVIEA